MNDQQPSVPDGLCECGCGGKAPLARYTHSARGFVQGMPHRFIAGHQFRTGVPEYRVEDRGYLTPCWIWQRSLTTTGYGQYSATGIKSGKAHRIYYERAVGPIPEGMQLDHLCRIPRCVNPEHLEPVTPAENSRRGVLAKLTMEKAEEIRALVRGGLSQSEVARRFGLSSRHVSGIVRNQSWRR